MSVCVCVREGRGEEGGREGERGGGLTCLHGALH